MGIIGDSYRTSVLNDFSIVSKAVFHMFYTTGGLENYMYDKSLPVQINPYELSVSDGTKSIYARDGGIGRSDGGGMPKLHVGEDRSPESLSIFLRYNIYDEYYVRTMDGAIGNTPLASEISLASKKIVTLKELRQYASGSVVRVGADKFYTLFLWGQFQYFGLLSSADFTYRKFSRWGDPLDAEGTVTISKKSLATGKEEKDPLEYLGLVNRTAVKSYTSAQELVQTTALLASKALR